jgi:poly-gamma-glutamate capsule biosynthesis protein CapA/YwtB (metallophosphatase superfamily)
MIKIASLFIATMLVTLPKPTIAQQSASPLPIKDGFVFAVGGDLLGPYHPVTQLNDPGFAQLVRILRSADAGFANQEGSIFDLATFPGYMAAENGGGTPLSSRAVARDLRAMGITMVSKANNHATDWGVEGLLASSRSLDEAGVTHAGSGESEAAARAAAYIDTAKGKLALVATASTFTAMSAAGPPTVWKGQTTRPRPGISVLHTQQIRLIPEEKFAALREFSGGGRSAKSDSQEIKVGDQTFRSSDKSGLTYSMNKMDEEAILKSIRDGKQSANLLVFSIHAHETAGGSDDPQPADFLPILFHDAIDNGADIVVRHGPHVSSGIEIYKGKPIFYGFGSLFFDFQGRSSYTVPGTNTPINFPPEWYETAVALSTFRGGVVSEIRIYPLMIESSDSPTGGLPRPAAPADARRILERIQRDSAQFGTDMRIENGIGIIRVPETH